MKVSVIVIVLMILCFIAGFSFGFRIKQRLYEVLLKSWENATKEHHTSNHELLMEVVQSYDNFFAKHKECLLLAKRNSQNDCTGCEYINDDGGYCYDCYNCSKKYESPRHTACGPLPFRQGALLDENDIKGGGDG